MNKEKINAQGQYCNYQGTTIIAKVNAKDTVFWETVYQIVCQTEFERQNYIALPYNSYHMTTIRLFNKVESSPLNWRAFIKNQQSFFKSIFIYLQEHPFTPEITFEKVAITDTLHLQVTIPNTQSVRILKMAEKFDLSLKIKKPFHITLAYFYKKLNLELKKSLQQQISENLDKLYKHHGSRFILNPPELCIYNDMTSFKNWNGEGYPFDDYEDSYSLLRK